MENLVNQGGDFWVGKKVFLTGHTGFKGGWLAIWLQQLGAEVFGYALSPEGEPNLFDVAGLSSLLISDTRADLANKEQLKSALLESEAEIVFHLAAQSLVRESYLQPLLTLQTNVMGTAHLLEVVREAPTVKAVVVITTDKVYENLECLKAYSESDPLGGHDIYSASKAAAEIVTASYRSSFFQDPSAVRIASARAGNVLGGGDWADDRLIPDCLRAAASNKTLKLRYPQSIRPWQHVLEPLAGYLMLAERLTNDDGEAYASGWNFGPSLDDTAAVGDVAGRIAELTDNAFSIDTAGSDLDHPHEAGLLRLDSTKAQNELGWQPRWTLQQALEQTVRWQQAYTDNANMLDYSRQQIQNYENQAAN